jgi:hypothetical protein
MSEQIAPHGSPPGISLLLLQSPKGAASLPSILLPGVSMVLRCLQETEDKPLNKPQSWTGPDRNSIFIEEDAKATRGGGPYGLSLVVVRFPLTTPSDNHHGEYHHVLAGPALLWGCRQNGTVY